MRKFGLVFGMAALMLICVIAWATHFYALFLVVPLAVLRRFQRRNMEPDDIVIRPRGDTDLVDTNNISTRD